MNPYARNKVHLPGTALAATGGCTLLASVGTLLMTALALVPVAIGALSGDGDGMEQLASAAGRSIPQLGVSLSSIPGGAVVLLGGLRLRQLRSRRLVTLSCALAAVPLCTHICCGGGWLVALWVVATLRDPMVREAFAGPSAPEVG